MRTVEIDLHPGDLSGTMAEMRMWLDERRFEPSVFCCCDAGAAVVVRIDFKVAEEAAAFADRFGARLGEGPAMRGAAR